VGGAWNTGLTNDVFGALEREKKKRRRSHLGKKGRGEKGRTKK